MRDPERIDETLALLREVWLQQPEFRLGQLLFNAIRSPEACPSIFYIEDDALCEALRCLLVSSQ
ncbi:hypothetical protein E0E54_22665 [Azotobacter chroococcum]|uniref:Uncharacterized protein n=1 Tax=Azotobacter chroococcum TaxID=353 RepID=A0A4V2KS81_9GAMM|nr:hypothetical protein E0E53_03860 [Azotobacter chroococcum]TBW30811.1 hypothetical protein E0E54_22665 [Azotobacter chroococcum]TCL29605.1 hypothetical protein EV691_11649 [Azotobacter chroococcum]